MVQFAFDNWQVILWIYGIGALIAFIAMLWFWVWIIREEQKEAYMHPDEYVEGSMFIGVTIAIISSVAVAILWVGVPIIVLGLLFYDWTMRSFPDLTRNYDVDEEEEKEND